THDPFAEVIEISGVDTAEAAFRAETLTGNSQTVRAGARVAAIAGLGTEVETGPVGDRLHLDGLGNHGLDNGLFEVAGECRSREEESWNCGCVTKVFHGVLLQGLNAIVDALGFLVKAMDGRGNQTGIKGTAWLQTCHSAV